MGVVADAGDLGDAVLLGSRKRVPTVRARWLRATAWEMASLLSRSFEDGSGAEGVASVGSGGHVGDDDVAVPAGVAGAAGAVEEAGGEEAVAVEGLCSGVAAPDVACVVFEVCDGGREFRGVRLRRWLVSASCRLRLTGGEYSVLGCAVAPCRSGNECLDELWRPPCAKGQVVTPLRGDFVRVPLGPVTDTAT